MPRSRYYRHLTALLALLLLQACGGIVATPTPVPTPTPAEIAARAGQATQAAQSLGFTIAIEGAPVYTDATRFFALRAIEGALRRPDGVLATLRVRSAAGVAEIRTVSLEGRQYATNPLTRAWQCLPPGAAFDPAILFGPQGIESLLQSSLEGVTLVGEEQLDGRATYHLRGSIAGARLATVSGGLLGAAGAVPVDLWADRETLRLARLVLVDTPAGADEPSTWTLDFSAYDEPVDVRAPAECPAS